MQDSSNSSLELDKLVPEIIKEQVQEQEQEQEILLIKNNKQYQQSIQQMIIQPKKQYHSNLNLKRQYQPRLIIDYMVLQNFKSYAGKQIIGNFHSNFTSVVGPNGSGKSNLIQSMLFIFGFNASWMRLNKLYQLIHKSSTITHLNKASVEVHFKKVKNQINGTISTIQGSQFYISRSINMSSISKYYLNNSQCTQATVKDKLRNQGIDLNNNRFLILQGQVEQISQMKQKSGDLDKPGLLQYLEDIIGSKQFIQLIQDSVLQYNQTEQTKHQKGQLMKFVENELKGMNKAKQQAIWYVKKERKVFQLQNVLYQTSISNFQHESEILNRQVKAQQQRKQKIVAEQREKMQKQSERIKQIRKNKLQMQGIQKIIDGQNEQMNKLSLTDKNITQQIAFKSEDFVKYNRQIQQSSKDVLKIIDEGQQLKQIIPKKRQKLKKINLKLDEMKKQLNKNLNLKLKQQIKIIQINIKKIEFQILTLNNKLQLNQQIIIKIKQNYFEYQKKQKQYLENIIKNKKNYQVIDKAQKQAKNVKIEKQQILEGFKQEKQILKNSIDKIEIILKQVVTQHKQIGIMNNMFSYILQQKIPGVLGRLGDMGKVSYPYDEIITTCCARLDNIVVRNYQAAQGVIALLKKMKLGRVSCIILDKITQFQNYMKKVWNPLPNSIRLFDMIETSCQEAKIAFYFALSDTIYCQNSQLGLEYAMKDNQKRRRVISRKPQGYIIYQPYGLMIGCLAKRGGFESRTKQNSNNSKIIHQTEDMKEYEINRRDLLQKLEYLNNNIKQIEKQYYNNENDIIQIKKQKLSLEILLKQYQIQIKKIKQNITRIIKKYQNRNKIQLEIKELEIQIKNQQLNKKQENQKLIQLEFEQKKYQTKEINQLKQKYKIIKNQSISLQKQLQKQQAILITIRKRIQNNQIQKQQIEKKTKFLQNDINKLKNQQLQLEIKATQILGCIAAQEQKIKQCFKKDQELKVILDQDQKSVRQSKKKIQQAKIQVQNSKQIQRKSKNNIISSKQALDKIRNLYKEMSSTYNFMSQIDQIDQMSIGQTTIDNKKHEDFSISMLQTSNILNQSKGQRAHSINKIKTFPIEFIQSISPYDNLSQIDLDQFLLFQQKLKILVLNQSQNLKTLQGRNLQIITQFKIKYIDYQRKLIQYQNQKQKQIKLSIHIENLKNKRINMFRQGFIIINSKLKQVYQLLTQGGDAQLEPVDPLDPFSDGINFSVRPPRKSWKEINKLSGGQKTLSSLSLIFALHHYKPNPLYFMDEIDAALDFRNVSIVSQYIKKRTKNAQFIIISLRNHMFDLADKLVGVYKINDQSKVINLAIDKLLQDKLKQKNNNNNGNDSNYNKQLVLAK